MKECNQCKAIKEISEFGILKSSKDGYRNTCKDCRKIEAKKRYLKHKSKINRQTKEYYYENKEIITEQRKKYRENNIDKINSQKKIYREKNRNILNEKSKIYYSENKGSISLYWKIFRNENKEKIAKRKKDYRHKNREIISKNAKIKYNSNKEYYAEKQKIYRENNKKYLSEYKKNYYENNKAKILKKQYKYKIERKNRDVEFKIKEDLRGRFYKAIKAQSAKKNHNTLEILGCSPSFYLDYLKGKFKPGMSWENHGEWHIDHIRPCASFDLTDPEQQKECFHYTNTQPLWAKDNHSKGSKWK